MHAVLTTWNRVTAAGLLESCMIGAEASWNNSMIVVALEMRIKNAVWPVLMTVQHRRRPQHRPAHTKSHSSHTLTRLQTHDVVMLQVTHTATGGKTLKLKKASEI